MIILTLTPVINNFTGSSFVTISPVNGIDKIEISKTIDEEGHETANISTDLEFTGNEYNLLKQDLIDSGTSLINYYLVDVWDDCCNIHFPFRILPNSLEWCKNSCTITTRLVAPKAQYDCLETTMIWDDHNGFVTGANIRKDFPRFTYCTETRPVYIQYVILFFILLFEIILTILTPIVAIISVIIQAVCAIINIVGGSCPPELADGILDDYTDMMANIATDAIGCGEKHPSPLVVQYADNVCGKCNLTFVSSIFHTLPYKNLAYLNADVRKGLKHTDTTDYWIEDNQPIKTGKQLFDEMASLFNAKWRIVGNNLVFEHKDYWKTAGVWIDMTDPSQISEDSILKECYSWGKEKPAWGKFGYMFENVDFISNEGKKRYNDIVEWNSPPSPLQKGFFEHLLQFNASRFCNDGISPGANSQGFYNSGLFNTIFQQYEDAMIMNHGTTMMPKLVLWNPGSGTENATTVKTAPNPLFWWVGVSEYRNFPMWFKFGMNWANPNNMNLAYFWECENPRLQADLGYDYEAEIIYDCAKLQNMDINKTVKTFVNGVIKNVVLKEININFAKRTLIIKGTV